jgi:hypothetical protein
MPQPTEFQYILKFGGFVDVGRSLWRGDGSIGYNCCWSLPEHSFSGPHPVGLMTIFETSLFVASYDSQLRWRYSTQPPHGILTLLNWTPLYNHFARMMQKTYPFCCWEGVLTASLHNNGSYSIVVCVFVVAGTYLPSRCLAINVYWLHNSGFRRNVPL